MRTKEIKSLVEKCNINFNPIDDLPTVEQIINTLSPNKEVWIKPCNKYTYYHGEAINVPSALKSLKVKDIVARAYIDKLQYIKNDNHFLSCPIGLFVEENEEYTLLAKNRYERERESHHESVYRYNENDKSTEFDVSELFSMDDED